MEILTLIQTKKMCPIPIIIMGKEFWKGLFAWMEDKMVGDGYIDAKDLSIFRWVDTPEEAYEIIKTTVVPRKHF